jgi:exodeoxyribonuclease VII large subunit
LIILDIDPSFTVGEQELERQKTIMRLKEEGMFEMNRTLELPQLPKRLAVISSEQAAGYRDFINHLHMNDYGFKFKTTLFSAPMQGNLAPEGIISAMDKVAGNLSEFDLLLILRGGGSSQDLVCFDDYNLAANIAQFPIPVMVGVGHDHDYHIVDMVAHTSVKTPTALADHIVEIFIREDQQIVFLSSRLSLSLRTKIQSNYHKIELLEQRIYSNNPFSLFNKGYALVVKEGAKVTNISQVKEGESIKVLLLGGALECVINNKSNEK